MSIAARALSRLVFAACLLSLLGMSCNKPIILQLLSPDDGLFTNASTILVEARVANASPAFIVETRVNGVAVPSDASGNFSDTVSLDPVAIFNPIIVEADLSNGKTLRKRVTLIVGDGVTTGFVNDGSFSPEGIGLRLNDSGLDQIEGTVANLVAFNPADLLTPGTTVINDFCALDSLFGCVGSVDVVVANPPPSAGDLSLLMDSITNAVDGDIDIPDLEADFDIIGSGLAPSCDLNIRASNTDIDGIYALEPDPGNPSQVDVNLVGSLTVGFSSFASELSGGLCDFPLIGDLINLVIGDLEDDFRNGLQAFLADPDGGGPLDSPIADAIEVALLGVEISGPIGQAVGVNLETPLFAIPEDNDGLTLDSDARITALNPDPNAPDLLASYAVTEPFPVFGALTPGGAPYDLAISISTSAFNQLLKAEIESGLLRTDLTELLPGIPLTANQLSAFIPEFGDVDPATLMVIRLRPDLAPVITGNAGPNGETAELRIAGLRTTVDLIGGNNRFLEVLVDATIGLNVTFANGEIGFGLGAITPQDVSVTIVNNPINTNEASINLLLPQLLSLGLPTLADALGTFPIPGFLGLELTPVDVDKLGEFLAIFANLTPVP